MIRILFVGVGNKAKNYSEELKNYNCKFIDLVNQTSISELGRVLKNCEALISVDTGTMHLGCAIGIPVCAVFYKILKGSTIASDSVVGMSSVVAGKCDTPNSVYAGSPAKLRKTGITWDRDCP